MSRISSQIIFGDLTGGINNVDSKETINASTKKTQTPDMLNVEYFKLGGIKTMEGNTVIGKMTVDDVKVPNRFNAKVIGGWEYTKGNKRYMIVVNTGLLGFTESFFASSALVARERVAIAARNKIFFISFFEIKLMFACEMELAFLVF